MGAASFLCIRTDSARTRTALNAGVSANPGAGRTWDEFPEGFVKKHPYERD